MYASAPRPNSKTVALLRGWAPRPTAFCDGVQSPLRSARSNLLGCTPKFDFPQLWPTTFLPADTRNSERRITDRKLVALGARSIWRETGGQP